MVNLNRFLSTKDSSMRTSWAVRQAFAIGCVVMSFFVEKLATALEPEIPTHLRAAYAMNGEIHVNHLGKPDGKPVTSGHTDMKPSWSKVGDLLVFFRVIEFTEAIPDWKTAICVIKTDGSGFRQLTDGKFTDFNPSWTRDGSGQVIFNRRDRKDGGYTIYMISPDGKIGEHRPVSDPRYSSYCYSELNDGRLVVGSGAPGCRYGLMRPATDAYPALYEGFTFDLELKGPLDRISVSPSEQRVVYEMQPDHGDYHYNGRTIFAADFDAAARKISNSVAITPERADPAVTVLYPRWTNDESGVLYHSDASGKNQLYYYRLKDRSTVRVSTNADADYMFPCGERSPK